MLTGQYTLKQIMFNHFSEPLVDGKNLITEIQEVRVLFVLLIFDSTQPLIHQYS